MNQSSGAVAPASILAPLALDLNYINSAVERRKVGVQGTGRV
jgi:hypothetical protein